MLDISQDEVEAAVNASEGLVLIKATASWCGPCKMFNPVLEQLEAETGTRVYAVDIDDNPEFAVQHGIMSVPTTFVYYDGKERDTLVGAKPLARLKKDLEPYLTAD